MEYGNGAFMGKKAVNRRITKTIKINCKGSGLCELRKLKVIQGELKTLSPENEAKLRKRIEQYGFDAPFFVWKNKILDGTQRKIVLQKMIEDGWTLPAGKVPVCEIKAKNLNDAKQRLLGYVSQYGKVDASGLEVFLKGIEVPDLGTIDLPDFDFEKFMSPPNEGLTDPDAVPDPPKKPKTKTGDLYLLGEHRLLCGDATKVADVERVMGGEKADMVFTDPPYGIGYEYNSHDDKSNNENALLVESAFSLIECGIVWTCGLRNLARDISRFGKTKIVVWYKKFAQAGSGLGGASTWEPILIINPTEKKLDNDVIEIMTDRIEGLRDLHSCPKPVGLFVELVASLSLSTDSIYDPFLGSGTTIIAAEKLNRKCFGLEIDPIYCDVIVQRWEDFTGKKAKRVRGKRG